MTRSDAEALVENTGRNLAQAYVALLSQGLAGVGDLPENQIAEALLENASGRLETLQGRQVTAKRLRALAGRLEGLS